MALLNKFFKPALLFVVLLLCANTLFAIGFRRTQIMIEDGMPIPWKEIKEAILKP